MPKLMITSNHYGRTDPKSRKSSPWTINVWNWYVSEVNVSCVPHSNIIPISCANVKTYVLWEKEMWSILNSITMNKIYKRRTFFLEILKLPLDKWQVKIGNVQEGKILDFTSLTPKKLPQRFKGASPKPQTFETSL